MLLQQDYIVFHKKITPQRYIERYEAIICSEMNQFTCKCSNNQFSEQRLAHDTCNSFLAVA